MNDDTSYSYVISYPLNFHFSSQARKFAILLI